MHDVQPYAVCSHDASYMAISPFQIYACQPFSLDVTLARITVVCSKLIVSATGILLVVSSPKESLSR